MRGLAHAAQRRLRRRSPALAARLTWALRRREAELRLVERSVERGQTAIDVGANWGLFADRLARLTGRAGRVHAFEPNPAHARTLAALARAHPQLRLHRKGLSERAGSAELAVPVVAGRAVDALASVEDGARGGEVRCVEVELAPLDEELPQDERPAFVKCDVEGHELAALRGAERTLRRARPALLVEIEERHRPGTVAETCSFLRSLGYEGWCLREHGLQPLDRFDVERDQLAHLDAIDDHGAPPAYVNDFFFAAR